MGKNPVTTAVGTTVGLLLSAMAVFVAANQELFASLGEAGRWIMAAALFITGGGLAGLGVAGKDGNKGGDARNELVNAKIPPSGHPGVPPKL